MVRTTFTTITTLPQTMSRQTAIDFLHDHLEMIDLNPLITERHQIPPPPHATADEQRCVWFSLTDRIDYLPGGYVSGSVSYTCAFHDLPEGLQTHCYAPMGLDIRDRWSVCGTLPGEPPQPVELGLGAPSSGLYLREDVDMRCNMLMATFVKKTLKKSHGSLVERLSQKAQTASTDHSTQSLRDCSPSSFQTPTPTGSDTSGTPPMWPILPPGTGRQPGIMGQTMLPYESGTPSPSMGDLQKQRQQRQDQHEQQQPENGGLRPPPGPQRANSVQSIRSTSETIYRGVSRPRDYFEFSDQNPYYDTASSSDEQGPLELDGEARNSHASRRNGQPRPAEMQ